MKPRLGTINLDWMESEIEKYRKIEEDTLPQYMLVKLRCRFNLEALNRVLSKCTPIKKSSIDTEVNVSEFIGLSIDKANIYSKLYGNDTIFPLGSVQPIETFLSKTCINDWELNAYCSNKNKCEMCKIKQ